MILMATITMGPQIHGRNYQEVAVMVYIVVSLPHFCRRYSLHGPSSTGGYSKPDRYPASQPDATKGIDGGKYLPGRWIHEQSMSPRKNFVGV